MQLKNALTQIPGLRYMVDRLNLKSGPGVRVLMATPFMVKTKEVKEQLQQLELTVDVLLDKASKPVLAKVATKLSLVRDIAGTVKIIQKKLTLNDIELFELKSFALVAHEIRGLLKSIGFLQRRIPDLHEVITLLDPENSGVPSFYINNAFDPRLDQLRKQLAKVELSLEKMESGAKEVDKDSLYSQSDALRAEITAIEDGVRQNLSERLRGYHWEINAAVVALAGIDILIAKGNQAIADKLTKPEIVDSATSYIGLFNPQIKEQLEKENRHFQPIDIDIYNGTCLITGANMAGKTVLLKTLALSQALCQFGFFVPATAAKIEPVDQILFSFADGEVGTAGLSSYAVEMVRLNHIVQQASLGHKLLVLIDELARTTNPTEGRAIVGAVAKHLDNQNLKVLITTHYGGLTVQCRKLRVKGFREDIGDAKITPNNIGDFIDYSLVEDDGINVPHEALRIAQILGVDEEIIKLSAKYLDDYNTQ